ncbi:MAG TPA: hypothetical protein PLD32_13235 [Saprospiraceae bacterium]|nr:hypothetical protein [Saprospiraceae bacterium]HNC37524.1 hypothetical protein [Saprospiraceae bacterium]HNG70270.1 hypothetical protein [Saprospiraceae bacterium]
MLTNFKKWGMSWAALFRDNSEVIIPEIISYNDSLDMVQIGPLDVTDNVTFRAFFVPTFEKSVVFCVHSNEDIPAWECVAARVVALEIMDNYGCFQTVNELPKWKLNKIESCIIDAYNDIDKFPYPFNFRPDTVLEDYNY